MLNAEILDSLQQLGIRANDAVPIERRADPMDAAAGRHIATQGAVSLYRAGEIIIKIGPEYKYDAYLKEHRLSEYLAQHNISGPIPVITPRKLGGYALQLTEYIEHNPKATPEPETTGVQLAAMHQLTAPDWLNASRELHTKSQSLLSRIDISDEVKDLIIDTCLPLDTTISLTNEFANKLCHGDLHLGNILPQNNGVRLIDFESAASGQPLWDMARLAQAADKFSLNQVWYERCWQAWRESTEFDDEQLAPFVEWRSWFGVVDLLGRTALSQAEQMELAIRLDWARNDDTQKWSRV